MTLAVSVRLDEETQRALTLLEATGLSRSEAIREAILSAAVSARRRQALRAEVVALEADEDDRRDRLTLLEATGLSRSEAIREAILSAAVSARRRQALRAEVVALEADEDDRREMLEVAAFMEALRAEG